MKALLGLTLAFAIGFACKAFGIPSPAPPVTLGALLVVAMTTGYGRTSSSGVGFQGSGAAAKPEEYAAHLLELYGKCVQAVAGKK